jgi:hypothetical protein
MDKVIGIIKERKFKYICFFWFIISIQFVIGSNLQVKGQSIESFQDVVFSLFKIIFLSVIFVMLHYSIMKLIEKIKNQNNNKDLLVINDKLKKHSWLKYFLIIALCWIPVLLAFYPAIVSYDGGYQIRDFFFRGNMYHHPFLITVIYTTFYALGVNVLNSATLGMFLFSVFQMSFMAFIFAYAVKIIEESGKKWLRNISLIFYAIFPYNQLFSMITTKDVIFAGLMIVFIIKLYKMLEEKYKAGDYIFLIIIGVLMLLSRNNSVLVLKVALPFIILVLIKNKKNLIKVISVFLIIICLYQTINKSLNTSVDKKNDEGYLRISPFSQAVAKLVNEKENELTEMEKEKITYYFKDYKKLAKIYKSNIADNTTGMINNKNVMSDKNEFFKFMWQLGKKYPVIFVDSFLNTTRGYWYINDNSFNKIWNEEHPETMGALELFCFKIGKENGEVVEASKLPKLKQLYQSLFCQNKYQDIPVLYILFQPATYFYITLANLLYSIYKRDKNKQVIAIIFFIYFASCFLTNCAIVRYIYVIIVNVPIMAYLATKNEIKGECEK